MDVDSREQLRARSKILFGNRDRAEVGAAIGLSPDGIVNATDLALELGLPNNRVRAQLLALAEGGLLELQPSISGKRQFARVENPFWKACLSLVTEAGDRGPADGASAVEKESSK